MTRTADEVRRAIERDQQARAEQQPSAPVGGKVQRFSSEDSAALRARLAAMPPPTGYQPALSRAAFNEAVWAGDFLEALRIFREMYRERAAVVAQGRVPDADNPKIADWLQQALNKAFSRDVGH